MGLSNFPSSAEGMLPVLVMNTVLSAALIKNMLKSMLQMMGATWDQSYSQEKETSISNESSSSSGSRERRGSITRYESLCKNRCKDEKSCGGGGGGRGTTMKCCVCLSKFKDDEKVSELSCKHFFHTRCLGKWFDNQHSTCPLCRSIF